MDPRTVWSPGWRGNRLFQQEKQTQLLNAMLFITSTHNKSRKTLKAILFNSLTPNLLPHYVGTQHRFKLSETQSRQQWDSAGVFTHQVLLHHEKHAALGMMSSLLWTKLIKHVPWRSKLALKTEYEAESLSETWLAGHLPIVRLR